MIGDIEQKRIEKIKAEASLVEITWPACCLSCDYTNADATYCSELDIHLDNSFSICNFYKD